MKESDQLLFNIIGDVKITQVDSVGGDLGGGRTQNMSGKFTLFQVMDIEKMVDELNNEDNKRLLSYLKGNKDFRIITCMLRVEDHSAKSTSYSDIKFRAPDLCQI